MNEPHPLGDSAELAALYVTLAMTPQERVAFEAHLSSGCAACRDEVLKLAPVAQLLFAGLPPVEPGESTRQAIAALVAQEGPSSGPDADASGLFVLRADEGEWEDSPDPGISVRKLYVDRQRRQFTALVRMQPGAVFPRHQHQQAEECLVLEGDLRIGDLVLGAGDFQRTGPGFVQAEQTTRGGCLLLITSPFD